MANTNLTRAVFIFLVGCTDAAGSSPDASIVEFAELAAPADAALVSECFAVEHFDCGPKHYVLCVPQNGCTETIKCRGRHYAYCHFPEVQP